MRPSDRRLTPEWLLEAVRAYAGGPIALDPCTEADNPIGALRWRSTGGLIGRWDPPPPARCRAVVWCNPPFSERRRWDEHAIASAAAGEADIMVLSAIDTTTRWWKPLTQHSVARCDLSRRLRCLGPAPNGQDLAWCEYEVARSASVWLVSGDLTRFARHFGVLGNIVPLEMCRALTALGESTAGGLGGQPVEPEAAPMAGAGEDRPDEWRDIAMLLHEAYTAGVGVEVLEMYTAAIRRGDSAREAAQWACDEWDAVPTWWRWEADDE